MCIISWAVIPCYLLISCHRFLFTRFRCYSGSCRSSCCGSNHRRCFATSSEFINSLRLFVAQVNGFLHQIASVFVSHATRECCGDKSDVVFPATACCLHHSQICIVEHLSASAHCFPSFIFPLWQNGGSVAIQFAFANCYPHCAS
jgi:hypothetical protein